MTHIRLKLVIAGLIFIGALSYLGFAGVKKGWVYTVAVDSYLTNTEMASQRVRLCGKVGTENVVVNKAALQANFILKGATKELPVAYHGIVPDLFKAGCEVVVEGKRDQAGVFQADTMLTKCASKYEEAPAGHPVERTQ